MNLRYSHNTLTYSDFKIIKAYYKYFARPVYKFCRKKGLGIYLSLATASTLWALFCAGFFINGINIANVLSFTIVTFTIPFILLLTHYSYRIKRSITTKYFLKKQNLLLHIQISEMCAEYTKHLKILYNNTIQSKDESENHSRPQQK